MEQWKTLINKNIKLIFQDGVEHYSKKTGKLIEVNSTHLILLCNGKQEGINLSKIIRLEECKYEF